MTDLTRTLHLEISGHGVIHGHSLDDELGIAMLVVPFDSAEAQLDAMIVGRVPVIFWQFHDLGDKPRSGSGLMSLGDALRKVGVHLDTDRIMALLEEGGWI
jgi:hypothetical protein